MPAETKAITRIHVEGYRSLQNVDLEPGRVTVLIGANGAGKSNLLSLLRMVALMRTQSLRRYVGEAGGASALLHYGPKVTKGLNIRLEFEQTSGANAYGASLGYAAGDTLLYLDETVEYRSAGSPAFQVTSLGAGHKESILDEAADAPDNPTAKVVRWWLSKTNFFHFHDTSFAAPLRQNSRQEDVRLLRSDGSNLAAYLWSLKTSEEPAKQAAWRRISQLVRRVAPFIKSLQPTLIDPAHPETSNVRLDWVDERDESFGPHHLSDGTLRCIALFTALGQPVESLPAFLSIDEPELGLHPAALGILASLVRSASAHAQILLATQSPALLDLFEPREVVVTERDQGATTFKRLDSERLAGWLEDYSLSELYDKNVLGGAPMKRLLIVVEGPTEEGFVKGVLGPHLWGHSIFASPLIVTTRRDELTGAKLNKGGGPWRNWFRDLRRVIGENPGPDVAFTTLIDLYGLPPDFPQLEALSTIVDTRHRASETEAVISQQFGDPRLIPYVQRHEFEALVLAGLHALTGLLDAEADLQGLEQLRADVAGHPPEDVNDGPETAPSKRLLSSIPSYRKTLHGPLVVESTGLAGLRAACPRFDAWVAKLENL